ncbi:MAG: hypothetical protein LIO68_01355, partial [Rikenellaceae bacterium]|nr:hypothetical protein [Rikenellaceae bacterium]
MAYNDDKPVKKSFFRRESDTEARDLPETLAPRRERPAGERKPYGKPGGRTFGKPNRKPYTPKQDGDTKERD